MVAELQAQGRRVPVLLKRMPRARRLSLRLDPLRSAVILTLPKRTSLDAGLQFLRSHEDWIRARMANLPALRVIAPGAAIPFRGVMTPIHHAPESRGVVWHDGATIWVAGGLDHAARRVRDFLKREAHRDFSALCLPMAESIEEHVSRIIIRDGVSRWGSCSPRRVLSFSWRLVMAPTHVAHYLAAHEVAHLRHMNHGPRFWELVNELTPYREEALTWLKREGQDLHRYQ